MMLVSPHPDSSEDLRLVSPRKGSIGVYYAASSISTRLDSLPCPALEHSLYIEDAELVDQREKDNLWVVSAGENTPIRAKVELISYSPITVNGGMNLLGDYAIELAFYNIDSKRRLSSFVSLPGKIEIKKEEIVVIKGCENYVVPNKGDRSATDKFKFGR